MTMRALAISALLLILLEPGTAAAASFDNNSTVAGRRQRQATHNDHNDDDDHDHDQLQRRLGLDDDTLKRYKKIPKGFRKHPSMYSETYLRRAKSSDSDVKAALTKQWGEWTLVDAKADSRPKNGFYEKYAPHRDVPYQDFPDAAWQKDQAYLAKFLPEAIALVERALEAILSEYGLGKDGDKKDLSFEERSGKFQLQVGGPFPEKGMHTDRGGFMPESSYAGLKRRVLHAVMAQDRFTVAMGGHSAAAGHGNHFQQTYTIQIQRILEPIFARLGVKMEARNFGMGGLGTVHNALASGTIYGKDVDILMWDSSMTEKDANARGLFGIQALLSMDRAPLLWYAMDPGSALRKIHSTTGADMALYGTAKAGGWPQADSAKQLEKLPWATQYFACPKELKDKKGGPCERWIGVCWIDRSDFSWQDMDMSFEPPEKQNDETNGRQRWHPGNREHQLQGRAFAFGILTALLDGLKQWNDAAPDYKLDDDVWHVTAYYKAIKDKVVENKDAWVEWCEGRKVSPKFCMYPADARTSFAPRNRPWATSLRTIVKGSERPLGDWGKSLYDPPEVYNKDLDPPKGAVDVLAIVENGVAFAKNLARIADVKVDMSGERFDGKDKGTGSKQNNKIEGGLGWELEEIAGSDNCDGTYDSWCRRSGKCLMYGHNDLRVGMDFDSYSGWLIFQIPKVQHGLIVIKLHTWITRAPKATEGWCSVNNKEACKSRQLSLPSATTFSSNTTTTTTTWHHNATSAAPRQEAPSQQQRGLKAKVPDYCDDFGFEFAINGKITSWDKDKFLDNVKKADRVVELVTLVDDDSWGVKENVEVAIRMKGCGRKKIFGLTHIYWI